jgi:L-ascorbate metabolism protein UlaG (beta-lactamase superfamily)
VIKPALQDEALLGDVARSQGELGDAFRLWWLGQSGFLVQCRGRHLLFDPYLSDSLTKKYAGTNKPHVRMSERVVAPERLDFVDVITSTHNHTDHLDAETLVPMIRAIQASWNSRLRLEVADRTFPSLVVPAANERFAVERLGRVSPFFCALDAWHQEEVGGFQFTAIPAAHDQLTLDEQGRHIYVGYVVRVGPSRIYHSGDTVVYDGLAESLRPLRIDVALLPINGKVGNMAGPAAAQLAKQIGAKLVIPCHYDMFEFNTATPDEFVAECQRLGQPYRVLKLGERWSSTELNPR